ncbi:leukocyte cysteine proteinase inhibitor 1-like isoform X2 [Varanus komodoensis]|uniref:leukocyte cysteine proteinase inhibitor 1-like isoform X2 n=1 Tax=Varanus komodoensis TaxID=61221 RepID=UPI001CF7E107|nr:leukocyte cysteine proteinase inhibitor 1-like isoform X2 [Varanus komodoensis]XP_044274569.1 leukocyte cysteine proteinase inhibitor 1-like isoform X2 [Varanus komodoensis]
MAERMVGGLSDPAPATPEVQEIANKAISYSTQVVSGTNYVIKVQHGDAATDYVHLWVFQALPCYGGGLKLSRYQLGKTRDDPIP